MTVAQKDRKKQARHTKIHVPKNRRHSRQDKVDGREIDDWFEQQVEELERHGDRE